MSVKHEELCRRALICAYFRGGLPFSTSLKSRRRLCSVDGCSVSLSRAAEGLAALVSETRPIWAHVWNIVLFGLLFKRVHFVLHSDNALVALEEVLFQLLLVVVQGRHGRSVRHFLLLFEDLLNVVAVEDEQKIWMAYKSTNSHDVAVILM